MLLIVGTLDANTVGLSIAPDDSKISYSDFVRLEFVPSPWDPSARLARFDRILEMPEKGYRWDNPGTRIRFCTDAATVQASLYYNELHISKSARNSIGFYLVDGNANPSWTFHTKATQVVRTPEQVVVPLAVPEGGGFHQYEIILPYADSVDFQGVTVNSGAKFQIPKERTPLRYLAYGDSITQGFTSSEVGKSYAYLVAQKKGWQIINLGLGGRSSTATDGETVGSLKADVISVFMGANDWQGGVPLATLSNNMTSFLNKLRALQPTVPIYLITSLWVDASWKPAAAIAPLENYRQVVRDVAAARNDPNLFVVEGPELIDHSKTLFDPVLVHPNDQGFAMMAERLAAKMSSLKSGK